MPDMIEVIAHYGTFACGEDSPEDTARGWVLRGFSAREAGEWLNARCYDPQSARALAKAGITPDQAETEVSPDEGRYCDTIGYCVSCGDMTVLEALYHLQDGI